MISKLKIAVLLYGQPRTFKTASKSILDAFTSSSDAVVDFYLFSWDGNNTYRSSADIPVRELKGDVSSLEKDLRSVFHPVDLKIESEKIINSLGVEKNVQGLGQAYALQQVIKLASSNERWKDYDWVFVTRYDLLLIDLGKSNREGKLISAKVNYNLIRDVLNQYQNMKKLDPGWSVFASSKLEQEAKKAPNWLNISNGTNISGFHRLTHTIVGPWSGTHPFWAGNREMIPDWIFSGIPEAVEKLAGYCNFKLDILNNFVHQKKQLAEITWQEWGEFVHRFLEGGLGIYLNLKGMGLVGDNRITSSEMVIFREEHELLGIDPFTKEGWKAFKIPSIMYIDYRKQGILKDSLNVLHSNGLTEFKLRKVTEGIKIV